MLSKVSNILSVPTTTTTATTTTITTAIAPSITLLVEALPTIGFKPSTVNTTSKTTINTTTTKTAVTATEAILPSF